MVSKLEPTLLALLKEYYSLAVLFDNDKLTQEQEDRLSLIRKLAKRDYELRTYIKAIDKYLSYKEVYE